jgi:hypothetical protein
MGCRRGITLWIIQSSISAWLSVGTGGLRAALDPGVFPFDFMPPIIVQHAQTMMRDELADLPSRRASLSSVPRTRARTRGRTHPLDYGEGVGPGCGAGLSLGTPSQSPAHARAREGVPTPSTTEKAWGLDAGGGAELEAGGTERTTD